MNVPHSNQSSTAFPGWGLHWAALFAAGLTWPLLISGGQVTTYKVGMAVPDWPTTFGENMFLYDFWNASVGVFIEHRHRLLGSALGFTAIGLACWVVAADPRRWMKFAGLGALAAVCFQGGLGWLRVRWNSQTFAAFHACSGQAVFAYMVAVAVWTGPRWWNATTQVPDDEHLRRRSFVILALVYCQIVLGAWLRHFPSPLAATAHALAAVGVLGHGGLLIWRVERSKRTLGFLTPAARAMAVILVIQAALGLAAFWILLPFDGIANPVSNVSALIRTGHQANGALLLASAVVLSLRAVGNLQEESRIGVQAVGTTGMTTGLEAIV